MIGPADGRKPTTALRDEVDRILTMPEVEAVRHLQQPSPILASYLDLHLEANDPTFEATDATGRPEDRAQLGERRYAELKARSGMLPDATRGREAVWSTIAEHAVEALVDLTGKWPGRSVGIEGSGREGEEGGWGLAFFQAFVGMLSKHLPLGAPQPVSSAVRTWRTALKRLGEAGRRPGQESAVPLPAE